MSSLLSFSKALWPERSSFLKHLTAKQYMASSERIVVDSDLINLNCKLCGKELSNLSFKLLYFTWPGYVYHFIDKHNYQPTNELYSFINEPFVNHKRTGSYIAFIKETQIPKLILGIGDSSEVAIYPGTTKDYNIVSYTRFKY